MRILSLNIFTLYYKLNSVDFENKNLLLSNKKIIVCFAFTKEHWIDYFVPIAMRLEELFPDKYQIIYLSDVNKGIKNGSIFKRLFLYSSIDKRLSKFNISKYFHFDFNELSLYKHKIKTDIVLFTEKIDHINLGAKHRIFIPHYILLKSTDTDLNLKFNHIFIPTTNRYFYTKNVIESHNKYVITHNVGYPKFNLQAKNIKPFKSNNPVVIYAPSLERSILFKVLDDGILDVFARLKNINFIIKLHPAISSGRSDGILRLFENSSKTYSNIYVDKNSPVQSFHEVSDLMIADYGNVGAEYKLSSGKKVIYLSVDEAFKGGSDLLFRDNHGDGIFSVDELEENIPRILNIPNISVEKLQKLRDDVVYNYDSSCSVGAYTINDILENNYKRDLI
jgi:hypothetical protein